MTGLNTKLRTDELSRWEHFPHDADVGVRGFGASPAAAFEQAALALTAEVTSAKVETKEPGEVSCKRPTSNFCSSSG